MEKNKKILPNILHLYTGTKIQREIFIHLKHIYWASTICHILRLQHSTDNNPCLHGIYVQWGKKNQHLLSPEYARYFSNAFNHCNHPTESTLLLSSILQKLGNSSKVTQSGSGMLLLSFLSFSKIAGPEAFLVLWCHLGTAASVADLGHGIP